MMRHIRRQKLHSAHLRRSLRLALTMAPLLAAPAFAQVNASWVSSTSGPWTDPSMWSTNPLYPNNGSPPGTNYNVRIDEGITSLNADISVDRLEISSGTRFVQSAGSLSVGRPFGGSGLAFSLGGDARYDLNGGTLHFQGDHLGYIGLNGNATLSLASSGAIHQRGGVLIGVGGVSGAPDPGRGQITMAGANARWTQESPNESSWLVVGGGAMGTGTLLVGNQAQSEHSQLQVGANRGSGTIIVRGGAHLRANHLRLGQGNFFSNSGTAGFGTLELRDPGSQVTLSGTASPGVAVIGSQEDFGGGTLAISAGTFEAQLTQVQRTGVIDLSGSGVMRQPISTIVAWGQIRLRDNAQLIVTSGHLILTGPGRLHVSGGTLLTQRLSVAADGTQEIHATGGLLSIASLALNSGVATFGAGATLNSSAIAVASGARLELTGARADVETLSVTGGTAQFSSGTLNLASLAVTDGRFTLVPGANVRLDVNSLTVNSPGILDIADNRLTINYTGPSPIDQIREDVARAHDGGAWTGSGITSSLANANAYGVGFADFANTTIIFRLTRYGDADLDGTVNLADFNRLAANFGSTDAVWSMGDFNYDGVVNLADFNRLAANFGLRASGPDGPTPDDWSNLASAVPEPGVGVLAGSLAMLMVRRRGQR